MHETLSVIIKVCRFYDASRVHPHQSESIKYTFMKYLKSRVLKYKIDHSFTMSEDQFKYITPNLALMMGPHERASKMESLRWNPHDGASRMHPNDEVFKMGPSRWNPHDGTLAKGSGEFCHLTPKLRGQ